MHRYIYYRVPVGQAAVLKQRVLQMHQLIQRQTGVQCQLMRRVQQPVQTHTWMEVYQDIPGGFDALLQRFELEAGLASLIIGARHGDDFSDGSEQD
ncbi:MAG: DUF4936 family protein [Betaproteobacteria bacterium]